MSIWSTQFTLGIPARNKYGERLTDNEHDCTQPLRIDEACIDIATSPNMSDVIRLSIDEGLASSVVSAEALITPDEARQLATALIAAADRYASRKVEGK